MGKGFASVKVQPEKPPTKSAKLTPISQVQANLSSYFIVPIDGKCLRGS